jgi:hypothetical protein
LLKAVGEENRYYIQAKEKMAQIYLNKMLEEMVAGPASKCNSFISTVPAADFFPS